MIRFFDRLRSGPMVLELGRGFLKNILDLGFSAVRILFVPFIVPSIAS